MATLDARVAVEAYEAAVVTGGEELMVVRRAHRVYVVSLSALGQGTLNILSKLHGHGGPPDRLCVLIARGVMITVRNGEEEELVIITV